MVVVLIASSCAGDRPTLTDDLLDDLIDAENNAPTTAPAAGSEDSPSPRVDSAAGSTELADTQPSPEVDSESSRPVEQLRVVVEETFPHDADAFTQGLEFFDGVFLESTGLYEKSDLRRVDITTGEVIARTPTPNDLFAEGLTRVDQRLVQLTWKAGKAYVWDLDTLNLLDEFDYDGQGWGLCFNGSELVMTNGSANLQFRDPGSFELLRTVPVLLAGDPVSNLNELECVNSDVYINIWMTDQIIRVDQQSGIVNAVIDASDLAQPRPEGSNVLNGIAYDKTNDVFYLTGKLWPTIHRVRFTRAAGDN